MRMLRFLSIRRFSVLELNLSRNASSPRYRQLLTPSPAPAGSSGTSLMPRLLHRRSRMHPHVPPQIVRRRLSFPHKSLPRLVRGHAAAPQPVIRIDRKRPIPLILAKPPRPDPRLHHRHKVAQTVAARLDVAAARGEDLARLDGAARQGVEPRERPRRRRHVAA